jgi:long-chain acyl-CoA synthetase
MKTLNTILDQTAQDLPNKPFLVTAEDSMTFSELRAQVLKVSAGFAGRGVKKGDCVAIVHRNSAHFVVAYFALNRLGAIAVPINFMTQKADELAYMLNDCKALGVVTQKEFLKGLRGAAAKTPSLKSLWVSDMEDSAEPSALEQPFSTLSGDPSAVPPVDVVESDVASILYTSGTTGNPKGVMLTHRNFVTNCEGAMEIMSLTRRDVGLCILPMFHSFAWTGNVLVSLRVGAKLVISPSIAPAKPWLTLMGKHGVSLFAAVPQVYSVLAKEATGLKGLVLKYWFFRRVRLAISGAAPLAVPVQEAFEKAFGVAILEGYGLTETSPVATINAPRARRKGSVGLPIRGVAVKIVDDNETELSQGGEGEICVKGDNVMKGYFGLPDATAASFTKDGWLKTGDIGALDAEGFLFIRDRKKDMIIIKGLKVFSAQVEAALLEHPDVAEVAVIGIPDEHGDETIKAFFVLKPGASADRAALMQLCRSKLDAYKRPRDVEIVTALPKNALQKVLKRELRAQELAKRSSGKPSTAKAD